MPVAVPLIGAAVSVGGSALAAGSASSAANKAAAAQTAANQAAIAQQKYQYDQTRSDLGGYRDAGTTALAQQMNLLGLGGTPASGGSPAMGGTTDWGAYVNGNPDALANWNSIKNTNDGSRFNGDINAFGQYHYAADGSRRDLSPYMTGGTPATGPTAGVGADAAQQAAINQLQNSPMYEALFRNGQNTLLANASATGGLRGGNTQSSLANFGRDTLAQVIDAQLNRLSGVAAQGENAAAQTGQFGANAANQTSQLLNNTGAAQGNAAYAVGGANTNMINSISGAVSGLANNSSVQNWVGKLF